MITEALAWVGEGGKGFGKWGNETPGVRDSSRRKFFGKVHEVDYTYSLTARRHEIKMCKRIRTEATIFLIFIIVVAAYTVLFVFLPSQRTRSQRTWVILYSSRAMKGLAYQLAEFCHVL